MRGALVWWALGAGWGAAVASSPSPALAVLGSVPAAALGLLVAWLCDWARREDFGMGDTRGRGQGCD